jgi:Ca-activated chloride channel family protein
VTATCNSYPSDSAYAFEPVRSLRCILDWLNLRADSARLFLEALQDFRRLFSSPQPVTDKSRAPASGFVSALSANGCTEMRAPLETALSSPTDPELLQQIIFITDGSVGNEAELIKLMVRSVNI